jgi:hypothetical protein
MATWAWVNSSTTQDPEIRHRGSPHQPSGDGSHGFWRLRREGGKSPSSPLPPLLLSSSHGRTITTTGFCSWRCTQLRHLQVTLLRRRVAPRDPIVRRKLHTNTPLSLLMRGTCHQNPAHSSVQYHEIAQSPRRDRPPPQRIAESHPQPRVSQRIPGSRRRRLPQQLGAGAGVGRTHPPLPFFSSQPPPPYSVPSSQQSDGPEPN